jgi:hypothetical protein
MGYISRFMAAPTAEHLAAMKWVLRYVVGTIDYGYYYRRRNGVARLTSFINSDLAGMSPQHIRHPILAFRNAPMRP